MKARPLSVVKAPPPFVEAVEVFDDVDQGSAEWHALRRGIPTASLFRVIMATGKDDGESVGRKRLLYRLAGEQLTGATAETYSNAAMQRGKEMEPDACEFYGFTRQATLARVGFVRRSLPGGRFVGCSPDRLVGNDGVLETKTMIPELLIELAESGRFPSEHRLQCHGTLWVTGRAWVDLMVFYRGMPVAPTFRVERNEAAIREISDAVEVFDYDLKKLVERIRSMGGGR